jgi:predicted ester cyclase
MNNKQLVSDFVTALNERRVADLSHYLAGDVIDHNKIIHGEPDEPGAAFDGFRQQLDAFGELKLVPEELIAEDNRVVARMTVSGRHTGAHPRMPSPTDRSFAVEQIWILTVVASRITEIRAVSDRLGMFIQLGWDWPTE